MDAADARATFERELDSINAILDSLCRRNGLEGDEADGFRSFAYERIVTGEYYVIRRFAGRSKLSTYLTAVLVNAYRDYRIQTRGKWRPSAMARRLGTAAILLDRHLNRDQQPLREAVERVLSRDDVTASESELHAWAAALPRRTRPRPVRLDDAAAQATEECTDSLVFDREALEARRKTLSALEEALSGLPEQDQVILRLHYWEGLGVSTIARRLQLDQKPLYRRIERNLKLLRSRLEASGVDQTLFQDLFLE